MTPMKVLYVGGTGTISAACVRRSVEAGMDVSVLNRGLTAARRPLPEGVTVLTADARDPESLAAALGEQTFGAVVNFLDYNAEHASASVAAFRERTRHYVHISSTAVYQKPMLQGPYTESTPRHNPFLPYAQGKSAAEDVFNAAYDRDGFPVTIVRPAHTYDALTPPLAGGWTVIDRLCRGEEVVLHGDGTSLWTLTHARDFAQGLVGLLGNPVAVGESFHIASDFAYTWNQIYEMIAAAAGAEARIVHLPSKLLPVAAPDWGWGPLIEGDLAFNVLLDNAKIRRYVPDFAPATPLHVGIGELLSWRAEHPEETQRDARTDAIIERLVRGYHEVEQLLASLAPEPAA